MDGSGDALDANIGVIAQGAQGCGGRRDHVKKQKDTAEQPAVGDIADAKSVAVLEERRMRGKAVHAFIGMNPVEKGRPRSDYAPDGDRALRAAADADPPGAQADVERDRSGDVEGPLKLRFAALHLRFAALDRRVHIEKDTGNPAEETPEIGGRRNKQDEQRATWQRRVRRGAGRRRKASSAPPSSRLCERRRRGWTRYRRQSFQREIRCCRRR